MSQHKKGYQALPCPPTMMIILNARHEWAAQSELIFARCFICDLHRYDCRIRFALNLKAHKLFALSTETSPPLDSA